jgi:hypothetical protein
MKSKSRLEQTQLRFTLTHVVTKTALVSAALLLAFSAQSAQKNYDNLHKQLNIMNNIMLSSAKATQNSRQSLIRSIDSTYLQGQGAIFTITSNHGRSSNRQFFQMASPIAPVAPVSRMPPTGAIDSVIIEELDDIEIEFSDNDDEFERVIEIMERQREGARGLRSEQREISYEMRDIARERKDIEYQLQRVDKSTKDKLETKLKKLEKEEVALNKAKAQLDQKVSQQNKQIKQQNVAQKKARVEHFRVLNTTLVETLCLYGNGLQAVPNSEHISLIIKNAGSKLRQGYKDQILVFTKKDINACASSKLTAKKLLTKAELYQF